jgi:hypothetical protein
MVWKSNLVHGEQPELEWGDKKEKEAAATRVKHIPTVTRKTPSSLSSGVSNGSPDSLKINLLRQSKSMPTQEKERSAPSSPSSRIPIAKRSVGLPNPPAQQKEKEKAPAGSGSRQQQQAKPPAAPASKSKNTSAPTAVESPSPVVEQTLGRILGQLDLLTKTIISMENRLTINEDRLGKVMESGGGGHEGGAIEAGTFDEEEED